MQHQGVGQLLRQVARAPRVALDQFDPEFALQRGRHAAADVAAAGQQHVAVGVQARAQLLDDPAQLGAGGQHEYLVVHLQPQLRLRRHRLPVAVHRGHVQLRLRQALVQFGQAAPGGRRARADPHRGQLGEALGELDHLQHAGLADQPLDAARRDLLRADQHVDRQGVGLEQVVPAMDVLRGAHPGDAQRRLEQAVGDLAGDHVDLVAGGQRDQHVGVLGAGLGQDGGVRAVAAQGAQVDPAADALQQLLVQID